MTIELFGLPASGKSTIARALAKSGWPTVRIQSRRELLWYALLHIAAHPLRSFWHAVYIVRYSTSVRTAYLKWSNLFLHALALARKAESMPRAVLDQGPYQNLLSLFDTVPSALEMDRVLSVLPPPDKLMILTLDEEDRTRRLAARAKLPRIEFGTAYAASFAATRPATLKVALSSFARSSALLVRVPVACIGDALNEVHKDESTVSYITAARMPTEKAHGASVAHMCAAFAAEGARVELVVPERKNVITENIYEYYGVPRTFSVRIIPVTDFVGRGFTHPVFFFLQRILFVRAVRRSGIADGIVYTREPEIVAAFSSTHQTVYEAHRWPVGSARLLVARLVRRAAWIVANSNGTAAAAHDLGLVQTVVAPNGFDEAAFNSPESQVEARARLNLPQHAKVALYVGSLEAHKGVQILYDAARLLNPDIVTAVIGGSAESLPGLAMRFPEVVFLGNRPYRELANNLAAGDVLVLPNTAQDEESARFTSPIKVFGYMAAKRPVIASDLPSVREVLDESLAYLVRPDDPFALSQGIRAAIIGGADTKRRVASAAARAKQYTWHARAAYIMQILRSGL